MDIKKAIGKKIQAIRKRRGVTQEKLAELIGIEVPSMSNLETGKYAPSIETIKKLSDVLQVRPYEFYYFDDISADDMRHEIIQALNENSKLVKIFYSILKITEF